MGVKVYDADKVVRDLCGRILSGEAAHEDVFLVHIALATIEKLTRDGPVYVTKPEGDFATLVGLIADAQKERDRQEKIARAHDLYRRAAQDNRAHLPLVKRLFTTECKTWSKVAKRLNSDGVKNGRGGVWNCTSVRYLLELDEHLFN